MVEYKRYESESEEELIYRVCLEKDKIGTWDEVADILNKILGYEYTNSKYRKQFQAFQKMLEANQSKFVDSDAQLEEIKLAMETLKKERIKLQTEKLEYARWFREDARDELFEEKVIESIRANIGKQEEIKNIPIIHDERAGVLAIADAHFAKEFKIYGLFNEVLNEYSPEIFYNRMEQLYSETLEYVNKNNLDKIHIFNLGDSVEGLIRHSQLFSLRYGVIDSATIFGNYLGKWLRILSKEINIEYHQTDGNHDELRLLDGKKGQHLNESAGKIISNAIKLINEENPNFKFTENKTGMIFTNVVGYNILGIHGEVPSLSNAIKDYSDIYNIKIDYIYGGHKHHTEFSNCGVRRGAISVGSIMGIEDFSMTIRKASDATASIAIFEKGKGKTDEHIVVLN